MVKGDADTRISIRLAEPGDVPLIVELLVADDIGGHGDSADPEFLDAYAAAFERIAASPVEHLYVAEWDGVVAGTFKTTLLSVMSGRGATSLLVQTVHVRPDLRGNGIGHQMMRFCVRQAESAGAASVQLSTNRLRVDAHRFYERLGFRQTHFGYRLAVK